MFIPIALYKFKLIICNINSRIHKIIFRSLCISFAFTFLYFFIKPYYVLLGDLSLRDKYFFTEFSFPKIEYWITKIYILIIQLAGLIFSLTLLRKQKPNRDLYFLVAALFIICSLNLYSVIQNAFFEIDLLLSTPNNLYLTVVITIGMVLAFRKIVGIDYNKGILKQTTPIQKPKSYELDKEHLLDIEQKLTLVVEEKELYKNRKLQLKDLSQAVNTSENYISEVLAKQLQTNYYDFVNGYRVKEVIRLMQSEKHQEFKLTVLAEEAGFNSKTTFNAAFKKITGSTPSEFRKTISNP
jgi:AraC-like DNA-binding protein